jgi:hypothetical protein
VVREQMSVSVPVTKDEDHQQPVPSIWRNAFCEVVEAFKERDFTLVRGIRGVAPLADEDGKFIADYIDGYGASLASLPEETWKTSVCQWQLTHWDVLVDLFTIEEGPSDLVLFAEVFEQGEVYHTEIISVHVP